MESGETYTFLSGDLLADPKTREMKGALTELYTAYGHPDVRPQVIDANKLGAWVSEYPSIAGKYIPLPLGVLQLHNQWASLSVFQNLFVCDDQRLGLVARLREAIDRGERFVAVEGSTGIGKTRLVLESVSRPADKDRVLYLEDADRLAYDLPRYPQVHSGGTGILVIDEVTSSKMDQVRHHSEGLPQGFTVIAFVPLEGRPRGGLPSLGAARRRRAWERHRARCPPTEPRHPRGHRVEVWVLAKARRSNRPLLGCPENPRQGDLFGYPGLNAQELLRGLASRDRSMPPRGLSPAGRIYARPSWPQPLVFLARSGARSSSLSAWS